MQAMSLRHRLRHHGVVSSSISPAAAAAGAHAGRQRRRGVVVVGFKEARAPDAGATTATATTTTTTSTSAAPPPPAPPPPAPVPRSIADVSNGSLLGFGPELAPDHPGFADQAYKRRRVDIGRVAAAHRPGDPIPRVAYTAEETQVWGTALTRLRALFPAHACREYNAALALFGWDERRVPQLQEVSDVLWAATGWRVRPVAGLMHPRDFLAGLAFRHFHSTQYVRHASQPHYTPEPDVVHELIGHVPMLAHPAFADMAQAIGEASLGADDKTIWHLTKVYWYTVEFGVVREEEGSGVKAYGAGILSSFGELAHMATPGAAALLPFDPARPLPPMSYKDGFQKAYFVLPSFEEGVRLLRDYAAAVRARAP